MSILKRAEPKSMASVIRPAKQRLVEGVEQTGRQGEEPWLEVGKGGGPGHGQQQEVGEGGGPGPRPPGPTQTHTVTLSKLKLPVSGPPIYYMSCKVCLGGAYKLLGEKPLLAESPVGGCLCGAAEEPVCWRRSPLQPPAEGHVTSRVKEMVCRHPPDPAPPRSSGDILHWSSFPHSLICF